MVHGASPDEPRADTPHAREPREPADDLAAPFIPGRAASAGGEASKGPDDGFAISEPFPFEARTAPEEDDDFPVHRFDLEGAAEELEPAVEASGVQVHPIETFELKAPARESSGTVESAEPEPEWKDPVPFEWSPVEMYAADDRAAEAGGSEGVVAEPWSDAPVEAPESWSETPVAETEPWTPDAEAPAEPLMEASDAEADPWARAGEVVDSWVDAVDTDAEAPIAAEEEVAEPWSAAEEEVAEPWSAAEEAEEPPAGADAVDAQAWVEPAGAEDEAWADEADVDGPEPWVLSEEGPVTEWDESERGEIRQRRDADDLAALLDRLAARVRDEGPEALLAEMDSDDRLTALLAGLLAGYLSRD